MMNGVAAASAVSPAYTAPPVGEWFWEKCDGGRERLLQVTGLTMKAVLLYRPNGYRQRGHIEHQNWPRARQRLRAVPQSERNADGTPKALADELATRKRPAGVATTWEGTGEPEPLPPPAVLSSGPLQTPTSVHFEALRSELAEVKGELRGLRELVNQVDHQIGVLVRELGGDNGS